MSDDFLARRTTRPAPVSTCRVKAQGSYRSVHDPAWGVNFGPDSDVDQVIPGSRGVTLRQLKDAGEIAADCFETISRAAADAPREG